MSDPVLIRLVPMREDNDCVIGVLASFLGTTYEDALRAAMLVAPTMKKEGYTTRQIQRIAAYLDHPLVYHRSPQRWNIATSTGILMFQDHVVILWRGSIWDPNGSLWSAHHYLTHYNYVPLGLFTLKKDST